MEIFKNLACSIKYYTNNRINLKENKPVVMAMHASWISKQISKGVDDRPANGSPADDRPANGSPADDRPANGSAEDEKPICSIVCESISYAAVNKKVVKNFESNS